MRRRHPARRAASRGRARYPERPGGPGRLRPRAGNRVERAFGDAEHLHRHAEKRDEAHEARHLPGPLNGPEDLGERDVQQVIARQEVLLRRQLHSRRGKVIGQLERPRTTTSVGTTENTVKNVSDAASIPTRCATTPRTMRIPIRTKRFRGRRKKPSWDRSQLHAASARSLTNRLTFETPGIRAGTTCASPSCYRLAGTATVRGTKRSGAARHGTVIATAARRTLARARRLHCNRRMANGHVRVGVACQGGGSHTAFTAGVLEALLVGPAGRDRDRRADGHVRRGDLRRARVGRAGPERSGSAP